MSFFLRCKEKKSLDHKTTLNKSKYFRWQKIVCLWLLLNKHFIQPNPLILLFHTNCANELRLVQWKNIYCRYAFVWNIILYSTIHILVKCQLKYSRLIELLLLDQQHWIIFDCVNKKKVKKKHKFYCRMKKFVKFSFRCDWSALKNLFLIFFVGHLKSFFCISNFTI